MFQSGRRDQTVRHGNLPSTEALFGCQRPPVFRYVFGDGQNPPLKPRPHHAIEPFTQFRSALALRKSGNALANFSYRHDARVDVLPPCANQNLLHLWVRNGFGQF